MSGGVESSSWETNLGANSPHFLTERRAVLTSRRGSSMSGCLHVRVSTAWWPACELSPRLVWSFVKIKHQSARLYLKVFTQSLDAKWRFNSALLPPHFAVFVLDYLLSLTVICFGWALARVNHSSPLSWQHCADVAETIRSHCVRNSRLCDSCDFPSAAVKRWRQSARRSTTGFAFRLRMESLCSIAPCSWWWETVEEIR